MHRLAGVHHAMSDLAGQIHQTSEQHVELRQTRISRDMEDFKTLQSWFADHSSFTNEKQLISINTGITATEESSVNFEEMVSNSVLPKSNEVREGEDIGTPAYVNQNC